MTADAAERRQTIAALTALLERSTAALGAAEDTNRRLYAAGLAAVRRLRARTPADDAALADPLLGLDAVAIENQAQALRDELEKQRLRP